MKLILFSGGVESTALLSIAEKEDLLLVCEFPFKKYQTGYDLEKCQKLADHYGNQLLVYQCEMPDDGEKWVHQIHWLMFAAHLYINSRPDITSVWYGKTSEESIRFTEQKNAIYKKHEDAWSILNPTVKFQRPLMFLSKKQQWKMIPDEIKSLVNSCVYNNDCGKCHKCKEFKRDVLGEKDEKHV